MQNVDAIELDCQCSGKLHSVPKSEVLTSHPAQYHFQCDSCLRRFRVKVWPGDSPSPSIVREIDPAAYCGVVGCGIPSFVSKRREAPRSYLTPTFTADILYLCQQHANVFDESASLRRIGDSHVFAIVPQEERQSDRRRLPER